MNENQEITVEYFPREVPSLMQIRKVKTAALYYTEIYGGIPSFMHMYIANILLLSRNIYYTTWVSLGILLNVSVLSFPICKTRLHVLSTTQSCCEE